MNNRHSHFNYIIVGGGSAGCVLANRLSADPAISVALIEAGPSDRRFPVNLKTTLPIGNIFLLPHARYNWQHTFTGGPGLGGKSIPCPRGKLLGGCSSVNGTVYIRGHRDDYDEWARAGNPGWRYEDVLEYFTKHENRHGMASPFHGKDGELDVSMPRSCNRLSDAFVAAAVAAGHTHNDDFNGKSQDGFGLFELNQRAGVRLSSSRAFLHPVMNRPNLQVLTDTLVERIEFSGNEAVGVTVCTAGCRYQLFASEEIVLAGGAINSPQLLMLSGVGPAADLRRHGIAPVHDLPGVGANLQDHASVALATHDPSASSYALSMRSLPQVLASPIPYLFGRRGMLSSNAAEAGGFFRSSPEKTRPDLQLTLLVGLKETARAIPRKHGFVMLVSLLRPLSRGKVELASGRATDRPILHPGFLDHEEDLATLVAGVRETRRILSAAPMAAYCGQELSPGAQISSDSDLAKAIRAQITTVYHPVGTCKMGPASDRDAVVDARLRVHGLRRLRVIDASIMPTIVGGNTAAPTMMIAERGAQFILSDAQSKHEPAREHAHQPADIVPAAR